MGESGSKLPDAAPARWAHVGQLERAAAPRAPHFRLPSPSATSLVPETPKFTERGDSSSGPQATVECLCTPNAEKEIWAVEKGGGRLPS